MGKTTRWLKSVFGMKEKEKNPTENSNSDKKRWSFAKSEKDNVNANYSQIQTKIIHATDAAWLSSYENAQSEHAVAVAAATAAAAEAAMVAAHAAAAVVKLTSNARGTLFGGGKDYKWAAVKIQSVFRGYLSRKALRALKGLVRLQALVRGYLVRKRAAATLHSMQALFRAQSSVRSQRLRRSFDKENRYRPENRPRKSIERFDEPRSGFHSKRLLSTSIDTNVYDDNPKTVEIDTLKTRSRSYRFNVPLSECGDDFHHQTISSPHQRPVPARASLPSYQNLDDFDWCFTGGDECRFSSAHNTPRFANCAPTTPTKSVCGDEDGYFRSYSNSNCPSYMMNTQSFRAKLRSYSAPKQRPELAKKRLSLSEIMAARNSMSGVRMNKTCYKVQECLEL